MQILEGGELILVTPDASLFLDKIPMDCEERDRLKAIHLDAVKGWTEAGGGNPTSRNDPKVVAAWRSTDSSGLSSEPALPSQKCRHKGGL